MPACLTAALFLLTKERSSKGKRGFPTGLPTNSRGSGNWPNHSYRPSLAVLKTQTGIVGNAITFDTTYKTNIYNMPLAMIISSPFDRAPLWLRLMLCLVRGSPTKRFSGRSHFSVEKRSRNCFGGAINYGSSKTAPALLEKPLGRSPPKHTPLPPKWQRTNFWCCPSRPETISHLSGCSHCSSGAWADAGN